MTKHHASPEMALKLKDAGFPQPVLNTSTETWRVHPQIGMMWYRRTCHGVWAIDTPMELICIKETPVIFARFGLWHESDDVELVYAPTATEIMAALPEWKGAGVTYKDGLYHILSDWRFGSGENPADVVAEHYLLQCQQTS